MNSARAFMRKEDYQAKTTSHDSPFRQFVVYCLNCDSSKLRVITESDENENMTVYLFCPRCRVREKLPIR